MKSIWAYVLLGVGVLLALFKRERDKNEKLENDIADKEHELYEIAKSTEIRDEINKIRSERAKNLKKAKQENEVLLRGLQNETDDHIVVNELERLLNKNTSKD